MTNPTATTPGSATVPTSYRRQDFPKRVYGETLEDVVVINSEEERPDGYLDFHEFRNKGEESPEELTAKQEAAAKRKEAKAAEKELRGAIMGYLDEHNVEYVKNISTPDLEALKVALDEHLKKQDDQGDAD